VGKIQKAKMLKKDRTIVEAPRLVPLHNGSTATALAQEPGWAKVLVGGFPTKATMAGKKVNKKGNELEQGNSDHSGLRQE
jgi:hypothetical protein